MNRKLSFRVWLQEMYYENCAEHEVFNLERYSLSEYFQKYKWWLRREYRHQNRT